MSKENVNTISYIAFAGAMAFIAFICVSVQSHYAVNGNISWLLIGAERLLDGQSMSQHIYEPNPPLSLLIYIPHVLFSNLANLPLPIGSFYVTFLLVILSILSAYHIIRHFSFLDKTEQLSLTACYAIAVILTTTIFYSEREHILILTLAPFMLAQFALAERITLPKALTILVFMFGALGVFIKPHYGLVPAIFLLARLIKHRTFNPIKAPDFMALSLITLLYIGFVMVAFSDYVRVILPETIALYIGLAKDYSAIIQASRLQTILYLSLFFIELFQSTLKGRKRRLTLFLYACCLLSLIPYYVQMKGFYNHLIPANSFFIMAISASIIFRVNQFISSRLENHEAIKPLLQIALPFLCVLCITNIITPLNKDFPTHKDMRSLPVADFLEEHCPKPCSFFSFHTDIEIMPSTAALMGYEHASRFGSLWPVIGLIEKLQSPDPQVQKQALVTKEKYSRYMLEDFEYYEPSILLIAKNIPVTVSNPPLNFMEFFGSYAPLRRYIEAHYIKKSEVFTFDRSLYFKGTSMDTPYELNYDVYTKK